MEPGSEVGALSRRPLIYGRDVDGIGDGTIGADLDFVVPAGVLPIDDVDDMIPVAEHVVRRGEAGNDSVVIDADNPTRRFGPHVFEAGADVGGPARVDRP